MYAQFSVAIFAPPPDQVYQPRASDDETRRRWNTDEINKPRTGLVGQIGSPSYPWTVKNKGARFSHWQSLVNSWSFWSFISAKLCRRHDVLGVQWRTFVARSKILIVSLILIKRQFLIQFYWMSVDYSPLYILYSSVPRITNHITD